MLLNRWAWVSEDNSLDRPFLAPFNPLPRPRPLKWYSSLPLSHHRIQKQSCSPEHKLSILGTTCICHWGGTIQWTGQKCSTGNWPFKCMHIQMRSDKQNMKRLLQSVPLSSLLPFGCRLQNVSHACHFRWNHGITIYLWRGYEMQNQKYIKNIGNLLLWLAHASLQTWNYRCLLRWITHIRIISYIKTNCTISISTW